MEVFDEQQQCARTLSLFPEDREIPADAVDGFQMRLSGLELRRPRRFGNCWLACQIWHQLGLDQFWQARLSEGRRAVSWEKVLTLLVVNHLLKAAAEYRVHRQWFLSTAMDELLKVDDAAADKDHLYRCLDRVLAHKRELFVWLRQKWADLFQADFEVLLYDLTSTYLWQKVRDSVEVKLFEQAGELHVLAKSQGRQAKEVAMRRQRLARLLRKLRAMRPSLPARDQLLLRIGAAKT